LNWHKYAGAPPQKKFARQKNAHHFTLQFYGGHDTDHRKKACCKIALH
jgi:hypothetical protein